MAIRAKFTVVSVTEYGAHSGKTVKLQPQYDDAIPEDRRFHAATPTGMFEMFVTNPLALEDLQPGRAFYIDLTPVEETAPVA